jgi:hypothetical protein
MNMTVKVIALKVFRSYYYGITCNCYYCICQYLLAVNPDFIMLSGDLLYFMGMPMVSEVVMVK